ncbi:MAG: hypothetical protein R3Y29_07505 [bacterium]
MDKLKNFNTYTQKKLLELADESLLKKYNITNETFLISSRYNGLRKKLSEQDTFEIIRKNKKNKHDDLQIYLDLSKLNSTSPYWVRYLYYNNNGKDFLLSSDFNCPEVRKNLIKKGKEEFIQYKINSNIVQISKIYEIKIIPEIKIHY